MTTTTAANEQMEVLRILGLSGSLRAESHNTKLLRAARTLLPPALELDIYEGLRQIPAYDSDRDTARVDPAVAQLREAIAQADALLIATPEYNGSIPGPLKNALDWASRPFPDSSLRSKPAAVVGASTGLFGAVWAQAEVRKVLGIIGAHVVEGEAAMGLADHGFNGDGSLVDPAREAALHDVLDALSARARATRRARPA